MIKHESKKQKTIGLISIGQSKNSELIDEIEGVLDKSIKIKRIGILDSYNREEIIEKFRLDNPHRLLISTLDDGTEVVMNEEIVIDEVQRCINQIEDSVDLMLLLCTSEFPRLNANKPLIIPNEVLHEVVKNFAQESDKIGVVVPDHGQIEHCKKSWIKIGLNPIVKSIPPYSHKNKLMEVANAFKFENNLNLIVLDCMGYTAEMETLLREETGKTVILSRASIAYKVKELIYF
ncbi:AroM family protein [Anaerosacchariphilus polymeriproducens]|nr:AroM family protein [Anaerosacchariphilus polymeriproducens]